MTTLPSDYLQLEFVTGPRRILLRAVGLTWPPPERLFLDRGPQGAWIREATDADDDVHVMVRVSMSQLPDDVADHPNLARGARYVYLTLCEGGET